MGSSPMSPRYLAFISPISPLYLAYISPLSAQVKKEVDMGVTVEAATTIAQVVTSAVVTTVAAGVGSTVAASVASRARDCPQAPSRGICSPINFTLLPLPRWPRSGAHAFR